MFNSLRYELRNGLRGLLRAPSFTLVAVLSIALGVGANAAVFSLVDQALVRQLPVRDPQRLVLLSWEGGFVGGGWGSGNLLSHPLYRELAADNKVFDGMFARHPTRVDLAVENTAEPVRAEIVSGSYFGVLGVRPALGRLIDETDDVQPGAHPVVVLSFDHWKNRLGAPTHILGRKVLVNNHPVTVVGVAAAGFRGVDWGEVPSLWIPTMMKRQATPEFDWLDDRRGRWLHVFGRLQPGVTLQEAQARLQPWFKAMLDADTRRADWPPVTEEQRTRFLASTLELLPAAHGRSDLRGQLQRPLLVLLAATGLVLLLACLNVANLSLARAFARRGETALRLVLGASRPRIIRECLVQSGLLALGGAAVGLLFAPAVTGALIAFLPSDVGLSSGLDPRVVLFAVAVSVLTAVLFGLTPALQASRAWPTLTPQEQSPRVAGGLRLRKALVMGQVALALILLIGAGLFVRTLRNLRTRGPGFDTTNLLTFRVNPARSGYDTVRSRRLIADLLTTVRSLPEVQTAGLSGNDLLAGGSWNVRLTVDAGHRVVTDRVVHCNMVSPGFFPALGAAIVQGRDFDERDARDDGELAEAAAPNGPNLEFRSAVVNEKFVDRYLGGRDPIGARLGIGRRPDTRVEIEIVGVVSDFNYRGVRETEEQAYFPLFESAGIPGAGFYVRTRTTSETAFAAVHAAVRRVDAALPIDELRTLDNQLDRALVNERLLATLASAFALLAVLLAVIGLYGVTSFVVSRRTREIGIRLALGASARSALWLVLRDAAVMVAVGVIIALPVVWALGRLVESQLFGLTALDSSTIAGAAFLIALVALGASALPAHRAASVNPTEALRYE